ncbi:MAG: GHKL domain-containing protein [Bacteroidia bacterium]|nr:GHKL domain-containing protein [Bacteroidia bacterium]
MSLNNSDIHVDHGCVFHAAPVLFLLLKPNPPKFTILDATDAYCLATQTTCSEIINRDLFEVFPDNPADLNATGVSNLRMSLKNVIEKKQPHKMQIQKYDIQVTTENGICFEERFWNPKNSPVLNENNELLYIIHQVEDVTGSVYLQNEIDKKSKLIKENDARINQILNALLKFTTLDFSERLKTTDKGDELDAIVVGLNSVIDELENYMYLLKNSNAELAYANKELDSFSYSVSHDLRAPLRAIKGYSHVLMEDHGHMLNEEGKQTVNVIIRNAAKMAALIDDLLTFSRIGKQDLKKITLRMSNMVDSVIREFTNQKQKNSVEFIVKPLEDIEGDNSMIHQVFTNLISNAIKYSGKKEKSVIEIGSYKEKENMVYYVKDNGAGFDMKYYKKLFGVFQRLHSDSEFEGTGVGIAMVQRIIKKHSGEVWAKAEVNVGATFYFSIPIKY